MDIWRSRYKKGLSLHWYEEFCYFQGTNQYMFVNAT